MDGRLRVTVDGSRHLFQNLLQEARASYRENFPGADDVDNAADEANLAALEQEIRAAYEMSRFALDVDKLPNARDDLDVFRGFCEDVDGLEPEDQSLRNAVGRLSVQVTDQLLANSEYRRKIPRVVEKSFATYVGKKSAYFDELLAQTQPAPAPRMDLTKFTEEIPADTMLKVVSELAARMQLVTELLESV